MLIPRYLFRQIGRGVLAALLALAGIGLLSNSLDQLELIIERGQSPLLIAKLSLLALPQLLAVVLPIAVFVGALFVLNRMHRDSEIIMCFAAGMNRWRVISPAMRIAAMASLVGLLLTLFLQPWAQREVRDTTHAVRSELAAVLVREGQFVDSGSGLTVYVQQVDQNGLMRNVFIHKTTPSGATTWDAATAVFSRVDGSPVVTLRNGSTQTFSGGGVLNFLSFEEYVLDLSSVIPAARPPRYKDSDLWLSELVNPSPAVLEDVGDRNALMAEAHNRISAPLYTLAAMAMALVAVIGGAISRGGYGKRIWTAAGLFVTLRVLGYGIVAASTSSLWLIPLQYLLPLGALGWSLHLLMRAPVRSTDARRALRTFPFRAEARA